MMQNTEDFDLVGAMMDFESGDADTVTIIDLFAHLVKSGTAWTLQGTYGRTAQALIDAEYITEEGDVLTYDVPE